MIYCSGSAWIRLRLRCNVCAAPMSTRLRLRISGLKCRGTAQTYAVIWYDWHHQTRYSRLSKIAAAIYLSCTLVSLASLLCRHTDFTASRHVNSGCGHLPPGHLLPGLLPPGLLPPGLLPPWSIAPRSFAPWSFAPTLNGCCNQSLSKCEIRTYFIGNEIINN